MTAIQAKELLKTAPRGEKPAAMNRGLTQNQAVKIIEDCIDGRIEKDGEDFVLHSLIEKRVYQAVRNQRHPRY